MERKELFKFAYDIYYQAINLLDPDTKKPLDSINSQTPLINIDDEMISKVIDDTFPLMKVCDSLGIKDCER